MTDDADKLILGDAAIVAGAERKRRRFFSRRQKAQPPLLLHCENCDAPMTGAYCAQCGQHAIDYRRSFGRVFLDVLDSFLNWDSKFFATLGLLITRPWKLTNDFLRGKRVRYVHPLRLYLLISVAFFFGVHELAKHANIDPHGKRSELTPEKRAELEEQLKVLPEPARAEVQKRLDNPNKGGPLIQFDSPEKEKNSVGFDKWLNDRVKQKVGENGVNAKVFLLTMVSNLPAMMLCCIPLFAFVLKVLYIRKRVLYIDHLIYALHIHAFAYLAILLVGFHVAMLSHMLGALRGWVTATLIIASLFLLLISIRRVYRQSWFMSVTKFWFGALTYVVVLTFALAATFFVTLALPD